MEKELSVELLSKANASFASSSALNETPRIQAPSPNAIAATAKPLISAGKARPRKSASRLAGDASRIERV